MESLSYGEMSSSYENEVWDEMIGPNSFVNSVQVIEEKY